MLEALEAVDRARKVEIVEVVVGFADERIVVEGVGVGCSCMGDDAGEREEQRCGQVAKRCG